MFLIERITYSYRVCRSLPVRSLKYLPIFVLFLQSCAVTKSETNIVPGNELSKTSLGLRETKNSIVMKEISPYSVSISRNVCKEEPFRIEYKAMKETVYKRQELHCAGAYPQYVAFQLTTFGVPFLYDLVSGFGIFRDMCDKGPPAIISKHTQETNDTVMKEMSDSNNTICRDVPISGVEVTAEIDNNNTNRLMSSAEGVAELTAELKTSVEKLERDVSVRYRYMTETITTTIKQKAKQEIQVAKLDNQSTVKPSSEASAVSSVNKPETRKNEDILALPATGTGEASKAQPAAKADEVSKFLTVETAVAPLESQIIAKANNQDTAARNSTSGANTENKELQTNTASKKINTPSTAATQSTPLESQMAARTEDLNASVKSDKIEIVLNSEDREAKAVMLTLLSLGQYKSSADRISAGKDKRLVQVLFKMEFAYDNAGVSKEGMENLEIFAETMKKNPKLGSIIEGHTDNLGSPEANRKMSFRRASAIRDVLVKKYGIAAKRIQVLGYGLTRPIADNKSAEGRAKNRRIEIYAEETAAGQ